jgi:DNA repair protein NreA
MLMMPGPWEFENFEAWMPGSTWARGLKSTEIIEEYEPFHGRKSYAEVQGGGYYASRIACAEKLVEMRRQAKVVVFREISEGYVIPLGVFVVRETARHAYKDRPPLKFATKEEAIKYVSTRLRVPFIEYAKRSRLLKQRKLSDFGKF